MAYPSLHTKLGPRTLGLPYQKLRYVCIRSVCHVLIFITGVLLSIHESTVVLVGRRSYRSLSLLSIVNHIGLVFIGSMVQADSP